MIKGGRFLPSWTANPIDFLSQRPILYLSSSAANDWIAAAGSSTVK
jgi:hypothetical protein